MARHVTIKEIAQEAGVHHSTVSRCLKGSLQISEKTRARVLKIAKKHRYKPNPLVNTLMYNRRKGRPTKTLPHIAFVTFFPKPHGWSAWIPGLDNCFEGARRRAGLHGFYLEEFCAPPAKVSPKRLEQILYTRAIKGVILSPSPVPLESLDWQWDRFTVVAIGPSLQEPRVHRVRHDHFLSMNLAMEKCRLLNYRRIGFIVEEENNRRTRGRWLASFLVKHFEFGTSNPPEPLLIRTWDSKVVLPWLEANRPDVVIVVNGADFEGLLKVGGYSIPNDIGVVSLACPAFGSRQSGIYENWELQGDRAVALLHDLLNDDLFGLHDYPNNLLVNGIWNDGATVRPQRPRRAGP